MAFHKNKKVITDHNSVRHFSYDRNGITLKFSLDLGDIRQLTKFREILEEAISEVSLEIEKVEYINNKFLKSMSEENDIVPKEEVRVEGTPVVDEPTSVKIVDGETPAEVVAPVIEPVVEATPEVAPAEATPKVEEQE